MSAEQTSSRRGMIWPFAAIALMLLVTGGVVLVRERETVATPQLSPPAVAQAPQTTSNVSTQPAPSVVHETAPPALAEPKADVEPGPTFDVVRVTPQGSAVVAGHATPGATVILREGGRVIAEEKADANGNFVMTPDGRLEPGGRELTLSARQPDGHEVTGGESVVVMVPAPPTPPASTQTANAVPAAPAAPPMAVLLPDKGAPPRVLQGDGKPGAAPSLALNSVDYDDKGEVRFTGSAKPSAPVRVYVDNQPVGEASTDAAGRWNMTPPASVAPGVHQLRVDQLSNSGQVQRRVELPFQRSTVAPEGVQAGHMIVQPGENLWRIARHVYGAGVRYTVIYLANREQIRNPNRIYPGQVFETP